MGIMNFKFDSSISNLPFKDQRQIGSGGMGKFAMRMTRVAMLLMKKYVLPVATEIDKNLVSLFVNEIANIISGKMRPPKALRDVLKHSANKTNANATGTRVTGAVATTGGEAGGRANCRERAGDRAPSARNNSVKDGNKSSACIPKSQKKSWWKRVPPREVGPIFHPKSTLVDKKRLRQSPQWQRVTTMQQLYSVDQHKLAIRWHTVRLTFSKGQAF